VGQGLGGVCPCGKPAGFIAVHTALLVRSVWAHAVRLDSNLPPETSKLPYFVRFGAPLTRSRFHQFLSQPFHECSLLSHTRFKIFPCVGIKKHFTKLNGDYKITALGGQRRYNTLIDPRLILPPYLVNDFIIPILLFLNDRSCRLQVSILFKGVPHGLPLSVAISVPLLDEESRYVIDGTNKP